VGPDPLHISFRSEFKIRLYFFLFVPFSEIDLTVIPRQLDHHDCIRTTFIFRTLVFTVLSYKFVLTRFLKPEIFENIVSSPEFEMVIISAFEPIDFDRFFIHARHEIIDPLFIVDSHRL